MSTDLIERLRAAVDAVAAAFDRRGSVIKERELEITLEAALRALGLAPIRQLRVCLEQAWSGRVGGVDLALDLGGGARALIELKWDKNTLAACAWDSIKLAAALQAGEGRRAFLVAGAPRSDTALRGDGLLDAAEVDPIQLYGEYRKEFDYWKADVSNHPLRAPASWRVLPLHTASLNYRGEPWRLRLAELALTSRELVPLSTDAHEA